MILVGETVVPPVGYAAWLACVAFTVVLVNQVLKLVRNVKGPAAHPPAGELDLRVTTVERDVRKVEGTVVNVEGQVRKLREDIVANGEVRKNAIEAKVEGVRKELSDRAEKVREELSEQINAMPDRIITILRNTNNLRK